MCLPDTTSFGIIYFGANNINQNKPTDAANDIIRIAKTLFGKSLTLLPSSLVYYNKTKYALFGEVKSRQNLLLSAKQNRRNEKLNKRKYSGHML